MSFSGDEPFAISRILGNVTKQATTFDRATRDKVVQVPRGKRVTILEARGCGFIAQFWLTFPGWFWQHWDKDAPSSQSILKTLIVRIYWDDAIEPAVCAPVGDFFGNGLTEISNFASRYLGMSSGGFFCSLPMPFRTGFRVELENLDEVIDTFVFANALYQLVDSLPADVGYLHGQFRTGENAGPEDVELASFKGAGRYVGCTLAMQGRDPNYLSFLEAPEYVQIDGDWDEPRIVGTGLEDYFLGGWYFREGPVIGPMHGVPSKDALRSSVAMYRLHDADAIHFGHRFRFTFRNPWEAARLRPFRYSAVAYAYVNQAAGMGPEIPSREKLLCWYHVRNTDHPSIP